MAYNVPVGYREKVYSGGAVYHCRLYFDNTLVPVTQISSIKISSPIIDTSSETGKMFHIGTFASQKITIKFRNLDGLNLTDNPDIRLEIGMEINNTIEYVPIGRYVIDELSENYQKTCEITCMDYAVKFKSNLDISQFFNSDNKILAGDLFEAICGYYGVTVGTYPSVNNNKEIYFYDNTLTGKQYIMYLAELFGGNAKIERDGSCSIIPLKHYADNFETVSGTNITINNELVDNLKDVQIKGNTTQDGTPTPESPVEIKTVTGDNNVIINNLNYVNLTPLTEEQFSGTNPATPISEWVYDETLGRNVYHIGKTNSATTYSAGIFKIPYTRFNPTGKNWAIVYKYKAIGTFGTGAGSGAWVSFRGRNAWEAVGINSPAYVKDLFLSASNEWKVAATRISKANTEYNNYSNSYTSIDICLGSSLQNQDVYVSDIMVVEISDEEYNSQTYTPPEFIKHQQQSHLISLGVENILEIKNIERTINGVTFTPQEDGGILVNGTATANATYPLNANSSYATYNTTTYLDPTTTYIISKHSTQDLSNILYQVYFSKDGSTTYSTTAFTTGTNNSALGAYIRVSSGATINNVKIYCQVEKGTKSSSYSQYGKTPIELCKIGTYQDYIYKENGNWYKHAEIGKVVFNGSESWQQSASGIYRIASVYPNDVALRTEPPFAYCNYYKYAYYSENITTLIKNNEMSWNGSKYPVFRNDSCTSLSKFITWLEEHNTIVYYILAESTDTQITDTTLINQLNSLEQIYTYRGITHIDTDSGMPLSIVFNKGVDINALTSRKFEVGDTYTLSRVCYDNGKQKFQAGGNVISVEELPQEGIDVNSYYYLMSDMKYYQYVNISEDDEEEDYEWQETEDIKNTLYLRTDNIFITEQLLVDNIYAAVKDFSITNISCENRMDLSLDSWDIIKYVLDENKEYYTFYDNTVNFNGVAMGTVKTNIPLKTVEETTNIITTTEDARIYRIKTELNEQEAKLETTITNVNNNYDEYYAYTQKIDGSIETIQKENKDTSKTIAQIQSSVNGLSTRIDVVGGNNLFAYAKEFWTDGTENQNNEANLEEETNTEIKNLSVSQVGYIFNTGISNQQAKVQNNTYTISFTYKKLLPLATCYVEINGERFVLDSTEWEEKTITREVGSNLIDFTIYSDSDNALTMFDLMGNIGSEKQIWSQNPNETRTETVTIGKGIQVESSATNTYTRIDSDGNRVYNKGTGQVVSEQTDKGTWTKQITAQEGSIGGIYIKVQDNQTWISSLL